jgi:hypothetical protein
MAAYPLFAQDLDFSKVKEYEHVLDDVMEIIDTTFLKSKMNEVEQEHRSNPSELNRTRLGIIYHEVALNLSFFSAGEFKGYARKSYDLLHEVSNAAKATSELLPFTTSYKASALSLMSAETKNLKLLGQAFHEFERAVALYANVSYCPEFMRGSVAENLPWFFFGKRKFAKQDLQSLVNKYAANKNFANDKIMSFTYWAWANQFHKKYRKQALENLDVAIALDPNYQGGRKRSEELKLKLIAR